MDNYVTPVLFRGLEELCRERPEMPIEFLAYYLIENNRMLKDNKDGNGQDVMHSPLSPEHKDLKNSAVQDHA